MLLHQFVKRSHWPCTLLFLLGVQISGLSLQKPTSSDSWIYPSDDPKLLFFAGIEGSGHDMMQLMWKELFPARGNASHIVRLPELWKCGEEWTSDALADLAARMHALQNRSIYTISLEQSSYPACRNMSHASGVDPNFAPRIDYIAKAARSANVDFRVILLHRSLKDALATDCMSRHYESCGLQALTLQANAGFLVKQLQDIHESRIACFTYQESPKMEKEIRKEYGLSEIGDAMIDELAEESITDSIRERDTEWKQDVEMLQDVSIAMDRICRGSTQVSLGEIRSIIQHNGKSQANKSIVQQNVNSKANSTQQTEEDEIQDDEVEDIDEALDDALSGASTDALGNASTNSSSTEDDVDWENK